MAQRMVWRSAPAGPSGRGRSHELLGARRGRWLGEDLGALARGVVPIEVALVRDPDVVPQSFMVPAKRSIPGDAASCGNVFENAVTVHLASVGAVPNSPSPTIESARRAGSPLEDDARRRESLGFEEAVSLLVERP